MKKGFKKVLGAALAAVAIFIGGTQSAQAATTLTVGASSSPHAKILEHVKPELKKQGINLKIKVFSDYILPNKALANKEIDANYFQHEPFLKNWNEKNNGTLINAGAIHLEPIGVYSKKYKSLKSLPKNATVYVSSNTADYGRVLQIFKDAGLITLKKGTDLTNATFDDIKTNKKNITFKHTFEAKLMPKLYEANEADAVVINANYAVQAGINPTKTAIALEKKTSAYANIIAIRKDEKNNKAIKALVKVLRSKSTQKWIEKEFDGAVIPVASTK
ncbi:MetQ/NlpA family ABC transporter substrate-binding protein [Ligilactobacillus apodemi]|uniref:Lipoprotein n=1 Tax=Ligilactobacillus apodemi DSM 16634 = JCM 16172 TaxID=1423724 RepID=A0A0R1U2M0_9LACO|nr:MetQ/NlpA family ABC transporter substrate-binding protein [Ligilactobacillus apodemi]KRL85125.1 ABC transporter substrate-binding protein [Ligilactobacillus apodemi DSM 16634 = JCM 16172]MCR1902103.1 MetQ/NlpA family ABC transporter substrate-binding protein [Ligilactobacillus apodemi]